MRLYKPAGSPRVRCRACRTPIDLDWERCPSCDAADPIPVWGRLRKGVVLALCGGLGLLLALTLLD
jgi:hypothetical protein